MNSLSSSLPPTSIWNGKYVHGINKIGILEDAYFARNIIYSTNTVLSMYLALCVYCVSYYKLGTWNFTMWNLICSFSCFKLLSWRWWLHARCQWPLIYILQTSHTFYSQNHRHTPTNVRKNEEVKKNTLRKLTTDNQFKLLYCMQVASIYKWNQKMHIVCKIRSTQWSLN